ncbi:hypothetical protein GUJ93_ZPchr0007g4236 [Zizania palustris]|uniref:Sulfotransferase n=1 Tax=Zizania palustris TaxID=103762 RepID=A0A8J5TCN2_ZIZPA|nr:hypothetical protein GUJ93_ZPchr0007g4236 [Zizania palustris]
MGDSAGGNVAHHAAARLNFCFRVRTEFPTHQTLKKKMDLSRCVLARVLLPMAATGPVPFEDVVDDRGTVPVARDPKEEFGDLVVGLPRKEQFLVRRLYKGFWLLEPYVPGILAFQCRFTPRPDDVFLTSYPKCGTTWLKALAFAAMARDAYPPNATDHPLRRLNPHACVPFMEEIYSKRREAKLEGLPSPRLLNTHIAYSLLPETVTTDGCCKVVYIYRDPKDMVVSLYHFHRRLQPDLSFADMFDSVLDGTVPNGPVWDHVLGYWHASVARPDRVLFLKYEDLLQNTDEHVRKLAEFMGRPFSAAEEAAGIVASIVDLCSFDKMKNLEVNKTGAIVGKFKSIAHDAFFRKGITGDWVNHMSPKMASRLDEIFSDKLRGTVLT